MPAASLPCLEGCLKRRASLHRAVGRAEGSPTAPGSDLGASRRNPLHRASRHIWAARLPQHVASLQRSRPLARVLLISVPSAAQPPMGSKRARVRIQEKPGPEQEQQAGHRAHRI